MHKFTVAGFTWASEWKSGFPTPSRALVSAFLGPSRDGQTSRFSFYSMKTSLWPQKSGLYSTSIHVDCFVLSIRHLGEDLRELPLQEGFALRHTCPPPCTLAGPPWGLSDWQGPWQQCGGASQNSVRVHAVLQWPSSAAWGPGWRDQCSAETDAPYGTGGRGGGKGKEVPSHLSLEGVTKCLSLPSRFAGLIWEILAQKKFWFEKRGQCSLKSDPCYLLGSGG